MVSPQKENGFTQIANEIIEQLIRAGLNGTELSVVLFILRKTYGYQKKQDQISISQFVDNLLITKQAICKALHNLRVVNIITLVNKGSSKGNANVWAFNKNWETWKVVNKYRLVNKKKKGSQQSLTNVVNKPRHTKERKKTTKEILSSKKDDEKFNFLEQLEKMKTAKDKRMPIIAAYWIAKSLKFDNKDQYESALKRELRPAGSLKGYDLKKIKDTMTYLSQEADFKWTLETVHKYIDEDKQALKGREAIITLRSGEKIYEIDRLKELETAGKIKYIDGNWLEI